MPYEFEMLAIKGEKMFVDRTLHIRDNQHNYANFAIKQ